MHPKNGLESSPTKTRSAAPRIVGIGASAGGLEAFTELLRNLPLDAGVAYVLVQHLDPTHRSLLSELLAKATTLPVQEISDGMQVEPDQIYVIPPNFDLSLEHGALKLTRRKRTAGPTRSIDQFLRSLAADQKEHAIGVILSGAGSDGAQGLNAIKLAGGVTFAQDLGSARYDSMPRAAIALGCVDFVLAPEKIGSEIARIIRKPGRTKRRAAANAKSRRAKTPDDLRRFRDLMPDGVRWPGAPEDANLRKLFLILRAKTGVDFSYYKPNTIRRRLNRRMAMHHCKGLESYTRLVRESATEMEALYQDLLINVTSFFRNPSVFEGLARKIFPRMVRSQSEGDALRIWVAGCSTGEEAYSLAMMYREFAERASIQTPIQIFASDVNGAVLEEARAARYTRSELESVSAERLQRFFIEEDGHYRVQKSIRDLVIFAQHNLLVDPPFTRVDMITCRNLLIYIEAALQQKILSTFHYALRPNGLLVLGASESVGQLSNLFGTVDKSHRIYSKKPVASWLHVPRTSVARTIRGNHHVAQPERATEFNPSDAQKEADRVTLAKYAPVSVLVNDEGEILQFRGEASRYLNVPSGKATFQLARMAKEGLSLPLQRLLQRARRENRVVRENGIRFQGRRRIVNVEVVPLKNLKAPCFLLLFEKPAAVLHEPARAKNGARNGTGESAHLGQVRGELDETREHLRSMQEEHETAVEELQASNEEVQSSNEELQSLNEELETSNEELESANEELTTLNEELATRNTELRESERRLREQAELLELAPVLARSPKDRIIFWNRGAEALYGFVKDEAIGQSWHLLLCTQFPEPLEKIQPRLIQQGHWEGELFHKRKDGRMICVASQWLVHHDEQKKVRAVLQVDSDITLRKQAEKALVESEAFNRSILESSPDAIKVLDLAGRIIFVNPPGDRALQLSSNEDLQTYWPSIWGEGASLAEAAIRDALAGRPGRFQACRRTSVGVERWWDVVVRPILAADGRPERLLATARDNTEQKQAEVAALERARLAALRADIALATSRLGESQAVMQQVTEAIVRHVDVGFVGIWTSDPSEQVLEHRAASGPAHLLSSLGERVPIGEGPIGEIALRKTPVVREKLADEPELNELKSNLGEPVTWFAGYPIVVEDRTCGVMALFARRNLEAAVLNELALSIERIAQFVDRKAADLDRARLKDAVLKAGGQVEILNDIGNKLVAELDLQKLAQAVTNAATELTGAELGVFCYNAATGHDESSSRCAVAGAAQERVQQLVFDDVFRTLDLAAQTVVRSVDVTADPRYAESGPPGLGQTGFRSYLAVPVIARSGDVLGALFFTHAKPNRFTEREERIALGLAAQASVAMDNARLFDQLERKVSERTARLQDTIAELQAFSYTVSHDLRAPLRAMQSYAQVLKEEYAGQLDERATNYLSRIERAGVRLDRLIQDVLTYSRISRAEISLTPLHLEKLMADIIQQYPNLQPPAAEIEIEHPLPPVLAEESSATQCFSNLLGNAVKFVSPGVTPRVRVYGEAQETCVRIWLEDNGIGIPLEHQERIFRMFERVDSAKAYEGTGIGLAIVRKAMERMGGAVGVESTPGQGSRFWVEFRKP